MWRNRCSVRRATSRSIFTSIKTRNVSNADGPSLLVRRNRSTWYETLKFNFHSAAVRCPDCRRLRRSERALREQIAHAKAAIRGAPDDPAPHLALAQALVEYHERTGQGRLDDAVAAAGRAARLWPQAPDVLLWEGVAHARAGRTGRARECLTRFLRTTDEPNGSGPKKAKEYLQRAV